MRSEWTELNFNGGKVEAQRCSVERSKVGVEQCSGLRNGSAFRGVNLDS